MAMDETDLVVGGAGGSLDPLVGHQIEVSLRGMVDTLSERCNCFLFLF